MCNAITHPDEKWKWLKGSMETGKRGKFGCEILAQEGRLSVLRLSVMCNAITHPAEKKWKWLKGSMEAGKRGKFGCEILAQEGRKIWSLYKSHHQLENLQFRQWVYSEEWICWWWLSQLLFLLRLCVSCRPGLDQAELFSSMFSADPVYLGFRCEWASRRPIERNCRSHQGKGWIKLMHICQWRIQ